MQFTGSWLDAARWVEQNHTAAEVDGMLLDQFSASVMVQVHDALNATNQAKLAAMPVARAQKLALTLLS